MLFYFIVTVPFYLMLTDLVCLYTYEFWLSLYKIIRSSVILLLPLSSTFDHGIVCPSSTYIFWLPRLHFHNFLINVLIYKRVDQSINYLLEDHPCNTMSIMLLTYTANINGCLSMQQWVDFLVLKIKYVCYNQIKMYHLLKQSIDLPITKRSIRKSQIVTFLLTFYELSSYLKSNN